MFPYNCPLKIACSQPSCCSFTNTKQLLQYTIKTHLGGPLLPKFESNMNYIRTSPPSSMKQCNKIATVEFHMELLRPGNNLLLRPGSNLAVVRHLTVTSIWPEPCIRTRTRLLGLILISSTISLYPFYFQF